MTGDRIWDVVVAGAGMGGLSAALAAAERDASVLVLEKAPEVGGNANLAAGMVLGAKDFAGLSAYIPDGDPDLQRRFCEDYVTVIEWLTTHGLPFAEPISFSDFRVIRPMDLGRPGDRTPFMEHFSAIVRTAGAEIRLGCALDGITQEENGFRVAHGGGSASAQAVVLATGGFQGDRALLERFMGAGPAARLRIRSIPQCTGDGLRAAEALGAGLSRNMDAFYGHTMADCPIPPEMFQPGTPYFARDGILLNGEGKRFIDESTSLLEEANPQAACRQPGDTYTLLFDAGIMTAEGARRGSDGPVRNIDWLGIAARLDFPLFATDDLDVLFAHLAAEGLPEASVREEIEAYNRDAETSARQPLANPPYYALRCNPGITAPMGGIAIDADARVRRADGGVIEGLYAAGVDAGGVFGKTYGGFLAWAAISGRRAGMAASGNK